MQIKSLRLRNIRSYKDEVVDFPPGSVLLSGDIGSGKSSILLALEFALFGISSHVSGGALLRKGEKKGEVELKFELNGKEVLIKRTLSKGKNYINQDAGYLVVNGKKQELMPVELKAKVVEMLGYPEEQITKKENLIFRYTIFTPQEKMKMILSEDAEIRLDTLRKVFGVEKYKRIKDNSFFILKNIRSKIKELKIRVEDWPELKKKEKDYEESLEGVEERFEELRPKIKVVEESLEGKKNKLKEVEEKKEKLNELKSKLKIWEEKKKDKKEQLRRILGKEEELKKKIRGIEAEGDLEEVASSLEKLEESFKRQIKKESEIKSRLESLRKEIVSLKEEVEKGSQLELLEKKERRLNSLEKELKEREKVEEKLKEKTERIEKVKKVLHEYETRKKEANKLMEKVVSLDKCPTCQQEVDEDYKKKIRGEERGKIDNYDNNIEKMSDILEVVKEEKKGLEEEKEEINNKEKEYERLKVEIKGLKDLQESLVKKKENLKKSRKEREVLKEKLEKLAEEKVDEEKVKKKKKLLDKLREKKSLKDKIKELKEEWEDIDSSLEAVEEKIVNLKEKIESYPDFKEKYGGLREVIEELNKKEKEFLVREAELKNEKKNIVEDLEELKEKLKEKKKDKKKLAKLRSWNNWLDNSFLKVVVLIEKHVMVRIHREFNELFKEWFSMLIGHEGMSARIDDGFSPIVEQDGYDIDVEHLSGGERTSAALAYRLALNKVINDVVSEIRTKDFIVLDEPTDGFSYEQLDEIKSVLEQLDVKQSIIVSHENKIESFVDNVIQVVKESGVSKVL